MDGSIERGYGGKSIFFGNNLVHEDLSRAAQYARLLSSIRLNRIIVNNVNTNPILLNETNIKGLRRIADVMRPWGIRIGMALNFDLSRTLGGLATSDPLETGVISWWNEIITRLYEHVHDLLGFTMKANSEGQPGPLSYNRCESEEDKCRS